MAAYCAVVSSRKVGKLYKGFYIKHQKEKNEQIFVGKICRNVCFVLEKPVFVAPAKRRLMNCHYVQNINQNNTISVKISRPDG